MAFVLSDVEKKKCVFVIRLSLGCERRSMEAEKFTLLVVCVTKHVLSVLPSVRMVFVFNRDFIRAHLQSCTVFEIKK